MFALIMRLMTVALVLACASSVDHMAGQQHGHPDPAAAVTIAADGDLGTSRPHAEHGRSGDEHGGGEQVCEQIATAPQSTGVAVELARVVVDNPVHPDVASGIDQAEPVTGQRSVRLDSGVCRI